MLLSSGWHICTLCMKSSHYMCFTCTFSLCKGCTKDADYVCVRGSKGFCATCMKTIMLIENKDQANNESVCTMISVTTSKTFVLFLRKLLLQLYCSLTKELYVFIFIFSFFQNFLFQIPIMTWTAAEFSTSIGVF